jgi:hypothetical protein
MTAKIKKFHQEGFFNANGSLDSLTQAARSLTQTLSEAPERLGTHPEHLGRPPMGLKGGDNRRFY